MTGPPPAPSLADRVNAARVRWDLSRRQAEVLGHVVEGLGNKEIAAALGCTVGNVEQHVSTLLRKSASHNRASLVSRFFRG